MCWDFPDFYHRVSDLIYPTYTGETFAIRPNENHKWYFQSDMMPDDVSLSSYCGSPCNYWNLTSMLQVLLFKCFDSKVAPGLSRMTPHTAFFNPDAPKDIPHRHSIEVRALVFHNEDQPVGIWDTINTIVPVVLHLHCTYTLQTWAWSCLDYDTNLN